MWKKIGLIFKANEACAWGGSHASLPVPMCVSGSHYRVFFSRRDSFQRSHIGFFELDLEQPDRIMTVSPKPILSPGPLGAFDGDGIYAASVIASKDVVYLYTIGWNAGVPSPMFYSTIGLALSYDGGLTFRKYSSAPLLGRSEVDPFLLTSPYVIKVDEQWRMYYVSGLGWTNDNGTLKSRYHTRLALSKDGIEWAREGKVVLELNEPEETNIARMSVVPIQDVGFQSWYSFVGLTRQYQIGTAKSVNGLDWVRCDGDVGIGLSNEGWDSLAQAYPSVVQYDGRLYMFYNGNRFGYDGVGLAVSEL